uniref:Uncharacterized protein n=1 Tax=Romanomermis culicivorax TaxID=13658 RepID=A0A915L7X8_ROMCU
MQITVLSLYWFVNKMMPIQYTINIKKDDWVQHIQYCQNDTVTILVYIGPEKCTKKQRLVFP